jgi:UDPglucose--hexose-1-phosphate uridylyltransferase
MTQNEIRQNKITHQWVIYAPDRGDRPKEFKSDVGNRRDLPIYDDDCPFCPGNEHMLPDIIAEKDGPDGWRVRVVPNKYPVLKPVADTERRPQGIYLSMSGYGRHEVIIEDQWHNRDLPDMSVDAVARIIGVYHQRYIDLMRAHGNMMCLIFRNHGPRAGTSLLHPHSQLVVTGIVPHYVRWREEQAQRYYDEWGRSVFADILTFELQDRRRVILENESFVSFVPFAAEVPFEVWIMPKRQQADFGSISDAEMGDLAVVLWDVLVRLRDRLGDPDYNYIVNSAARYKAGEPHLCWYFQIRPRLTTRAGFEIGSGISVNPSIPEEDAGFLKGEDGAGSG